MQIDTFAFIEHLHRAEGERKTTANIRITRQHIIHVSCELCPFIFIDRMRRIRTGPLDCDLVFRDLKSPAILAFSQF